MSHILKYGNSSDDFKRLSRSIVGCGAMFDEKIKYKGTDTHVRLGDVVLFYRKYWPSPLIGIGAVFGLAYGGWGQAALENRDNVSLTIKMLDGTFERVPIELVKLRSTGDDCIDF